MPYMKSVAVVFGIKVGSRYEKRENSGISHLIEHMLFKGTRKRPTTLEISQAIEGVGGEINAATSKEITQIYTRIPMDKFKIALEVMADLLANSLFREEDLEKEKLIIVEEIKKYEDLPEELVELFLDQILWGDHPLGRTILGKERVVKKLQREDLLTFLKQFYRPNNIVISIAGNIKIYEVIAQIKKYFLEIEGGRIKDYLPVQINQQNMRIKVKTKKSKQTHLAFGFPGISRLDPRRYALDLLDIILGSGLSSRLFQEIRVKKGLAYDIHSYIQYFNDTGSFSIYAGIETSRLNETLQAVIEELIKIKENRIPEEELNKAKEMYKGALSLSLESTLSRAFWWGNRILFYGEPISFPEVKKRIDEVAIEDIQNLARDIFTSQKINLSLVGPFRDKNLEEGRTILEQLH
ncbi:MAG: pitrilysin family protein [Candidatus Caldatribacteriota bacterium]